MARRRSRTSATGGNMDSMLDTLTNVVGILIIVLVTVQLSSQEAASRIAAAIEKLSPEEIATIKQEAADAKAKADRFEKDLEQLPKPPQTDAAAEAAALQAAAALEAEAAKADAAARDAGARAAAIEKEKAERSAAANRAAETAAKQAAATLSKAEAELKAAEDTRRALAVELEKMAVPPTPPAKEVRLPDPRPAPANAKELRVLCRDGRVWTVDLDELQEQAQKRAAYVVRQKKLDPDDDGWLTDGKTFAEEFNKAPVRAGDFEMTLALVGKWPQLALAPKPGSGEPTDKAVRSGGDLTRMLRRYTPKDHFIRFFVRPDGFEVYLTARQSASEAGYAAGWELVTNAAEHRIPLNKYGIGSKPPPPDEKKPPPANVVD